MVRLKEEGNFMQKLNLTSLQMVEQDLCSTGWNPGGQLQRGCGKVHPPFLPYLCSLMQQTQPYILSRDIGILPLNDHQSIFTYMHLGTVSRNGINPEHFSTFHHILYTYIHMGFYRGYFCQTSLTEDQIYETKKFIGKSNTADRWVSSCYDSWVLINMAWEKLVRSQKNTRVIKRQIFRGL